jgi:hypothetical protein
MKAFTAMLQKDLVQVLQRYELMNNIPFLGASSNEK